MSTTEAIPKQGTVDYHDVIVSRVNAQRRECIRRRSAWIALAEQGKRIYAYGEDTDSPDALRLVVNEVQPNIHAIVANHLKEPVQVVLEPVEMNENAKWYWAGPEDEAMSLQIPTGQPAVDPMTAEPLMDPATMQPVMATMPMNPAFLGIGPMGEELPPMPLDPGTRKALQQMALDGLIEPKWVVQCNDQYIASVLQKPFDVHWMRAETKEWISYQALWNACEGWRLSLYEWDAQKLKHLLRRNSIRQAYMDPTVETIGEAAFAGIDLYLSKEEAIAMYPQLSEALEEAAHAGTPDVPEEQDSLPEQVNDSFERDMVTMTVWWERNQPVPMSEQEAIDGGQVIPFAAVPDVPGIVPPGQPGGDDLPDAGRLSVPQSEPLAPTYTLPDGTPVAPGDDAWPTKPGIRQVTIIKKIVVEDLECPHWDIPLLHMVNIPVSGQPWGMSESFRLLPMQNAYSNVTRWMTEHAEYYSSPMLVGPKSVQAAFGEDGKRLHAQPGKVWWIDDDLYKQFGKDTISAVNPPTLPPAMQQIRMDLKEDMREQSGRTEAMRGITPTKTASGEMVANLQAAAVEPLAIKAMSIEFMVYRLSMLMLHSIIHFMSAEQLARIVSIPLPLLRHVLERALEIEWSMKVTVSTGSGAMLSRKRAELLQYNQMTSPDDLLPLVDGKSTREGLGFDPEEIAQRARTASQNSVNARVQEEMDKESEKNGKEKDDA